MQNQTSQVELITTEGQYRVTRIQSEVPQKSFVNNQNPELNQSNIEQKETRTNGFWGILYFLSQVLFLIITYYAIKKGDPQKLNALITYENIQCGVSKGYEKCPILFYSETLSYCSSVCQSGEVLLCNGEKLNVESNMYGELIYGNRPWLCLVDDTKSIPLTIFLEILVISATTIGLSIILLSFMKDCLGVINSMASFLVLVLSLATLIYYCYFMIKYDYPADKWVLFACLGLIFSLYSIYKIVYYCKYSELIQESFLDAKQIISKLDTAELFTVLMLFIFIIISTYQLIVIIFILSSGQPQPFYYDPVTFKVDINENQWLMLVFAIICYYWNCMFIITFQKCVYSHACVKVYGQQIDSNNKFISDSIKYNWKYNLGTIAQVSLTQQISQLLLMTLCFFNRNVINNHTFTYMHYKQQSYYESSRETSQIFKANQQISRDSSELGSLAVWSSTLFSCILITTLAIVYYLYDHFGGLIYYYLVMYCIFVSLMVSTIIFNSYEMVLDSIYFLSLIEFKNNKQIESQPKIQNYISSNIVINIMRNYEFFLQKI